MNPEHLALACVMSPLIGFAVALLGFRKQHAIASGIVITSGLVSVVTSAILLFTYHGEAVAFTAPWFMIGEVEVGFGLLLDGRTLIMGSVVALITLCIQVYSLAYMAHDPGRGRFFAFLAFFGWSMLSFVYASNLLQMFIFWELVGLASFLLIGFWYEKPSAVAAAKKAFIMTRVGDVGLFIGLILLFLTTGSLDVVGINALFSPEGLPDAQSIAPGRIELIAMLMFIGIVGKSAQFPLHTWLPDAMEGPTPVSALLHSATMVAAGVFLFARFHALFLDAPTTMNVVLAIATFTALLSSTMAMVAKDMKRVLAFSSISQLGFMMIGLSAGSLFAGYFHLTTHAFFKALLFLCAGAYIHHTGTNDMIAMGRAGARKMKVTTVGLIVGCSALAGIPGLAGFFSKESILHALGHSTTLNHTYAGIMKYCVLFAALLTAYYSFRMIFLITRPNPDSAATEDEPAHAQHSDQHHDGPAEPLPMMLPILVLSVGALIVGYFGPKIGHTLDPDAHVATWLKDLQAGLVPMAFAGAGVLLAWFAFGSKKSSQTGLVARFPAIQTLFERRWYIDEIYNRVFVRPAVAIAMLCYGTETKGLDGGTDQFAFSIAKAGAETAKRHSGRLQLYVGGAVAVVAILSFYLGMK